MARNRSTQLERVGTAGKPGLALGMLLAIVLAAVLPPKPAVTETFRAATWNGANSTIDKFLRDFARLARDASDGSVDFEVYSGGVLLPAKGTLEGVQWGVAHIANITAAYIPAKMPVDFVAVDMSFVADDQLALAFAKTEVGFFNEQMQDEIKRLDLVFATSFATSIYYFICGFDADSIDDFVGKKIRTTSDAQVGFVNAIGGVAVSAPANDIYTGIQRGTLDCTAGTPLFLTDFFRLAEVADSVYTIPLGSSANGGYYMNKAFWRQRTPDERRIILRALSRATARSMVEWAGRIDDAWQATRDAGVAIREPEPAAMQALQDYTRDFLANLPRKSMAARGIADPTPLIDDLNASIAKWKRLLAEIDRTDAEAVAALLDREIFDRLDVGTYGLD